MRETRMIEYNGKVYNSSELARAHGLNPVTFRNRLNFGWDVEKALTAPVKKGGVRKYYCRAKSWKECFSCKLPDCTRPWERKLEGEPSFRDINS